MNRSSIFALAAAAAIGATTVVVVQSGTAEAQAPVDCTTPAPVVVEASVRRVIFDLQPDGGCMVTPDIDQSNIERRFAPRPRQVRQAAVCNAARAVAERAAKLDLGITDGGLP